MIFLITSFNYDLLNLTPRGLVVARNVVSVQPNIITQERPNPNDRSVGPRSPAHRVSADDNEPNRTGV
jgi:hypothetical protein